jgi:proline iminopeptidase
VPRGGPRPTRRPPLRPPRPGEHLTEQILVDDCESIRESLNILRWTVIGHSFGGRIALRYACQHPNRVTAAIFENPCWDFDDTERQRLPAAAAIFDELGDRDSADRCRRIATRSARIVDWRETVALVGQLQQHDRYDDLYFHQLAAREQWLSTDMSAFSEEQLSRAQAHNEQAMDGCMEPLVDMLAELATPAILIKGKYDLVTGPGQLGAFRAKVPHGEVRHFEESGHFVQLEESEAYAELVTCWRR